MLLALVLAASPLDEIPDELRETFGEMAGRGLTVARPKAELRLEIALPRRVFEQGEVVRVVAKFVNGGREDVMIVRRGHEPRRPDARYGFVLVDPQGRPAKPVRRFFGAACGLRLPLQREDVFELKRGESSAAFEYGFVLDFEPGAYRLSLTYAWDDAFPAAPPSQVRLVSNALPLEITAP